MLKKIKIILVTISLMFLAFGFSPITKADTGNTLYVGGTGSGNYTKIQYAIDDSSIGDTIYVYSGEYPENIVISHSIDLIGEDKNTTVIYGPDTGNVIFFSASNVNITGFKMMNGYDAYCLIIEEDNNNIFGNIFTDNFYGIRIQETAANNLIYNNNFTMNTFGLVVCDAGYNKITNNIFTDNDIGINLESGSFENIIYHNYFINNTFKSFDYSNCENQWDDVYPSGGNFWDDYTGVDNYQGPNQNITGSDGIGDTPYIIQGPYECLDSYPLIASSPSPNNTPNTPYNPTPPNDATSINIDQDLYWNCTDPDGDPLTYDVYFGTTNPPNTKVSSNQSISIYDPGTMNYNTKYYWKIIAWDNHGLSTTGPIWDFTTKMNNPPNTPSNPNPSNHLTSVDINATLSWTGGDPDIGDTVTYDIYFGTTSTPIKKISNQSATSYNPGTMNYNTKYYWKIIAWDNHGESTTGPIWDFTTGNEPNDPPNIPSDPNPVNQSTGIDLNTDLSWTGGDPDAGDTVTYDIYLGTSSDLPLHKSNHDSTSYDPGTMSSNTTYYWKIVSKDNHGRSTTGPVWDFTTVYVNQPPNTPYNPTPQNGKTSVNIDQNLFWSGGDPDSGDTVTYDVFFGTTSTPIKKISNHSATSYNPGTMNYNTKYYWKIIAGDNYGNSSNGPIWSFTTASQSTGGGPGGGSPFLPPNIVPVADASASENSGFVNTAVTFNGSYSYDEDGEITNYTWNFGDSIDRYGILKTHVYLKVGTYNVKLTVTDNNDVSDTDSFKVIISQPNNPPTIPQIDGPKTGKQNIEYNFTVFSTDADNDNIQYVFNWGDDQTTETDFIPNGTISIEKHIWISSGIFNIKIFAIDSNYASSDSADFTILIDVRYCKDIGYFIDDNSDEIYDTFYSNVTGLVTDLVYEDGDYLIDTDGDGIENYFYNLENDALTKIETPEKDETSEDENVTLYLIALLIIIILIVLILIGKRPKHKVEDEKEKPVEEKSSTKKSKTQKKGKKTKKQQPMKSRKTKKK